METRTGVTPPRVVPQPAPGPGPGPGAGPGPGPGPGAGLRLLGPADRPLYIRVERTVGSIAKQTVAALLDEVAFYKRLPREFVAGELSEVALSAQRAFYRCLRAGVRPGEADLSFTYASAARRADERVPLEAVLAAHHVGARVGTEAMAAMAQPGEEADLVAAVVFLQQYMQYATGAVIAAYMEEQRGAHGESRDGLRTLARTLLAGAPADDAADEAGVPLAAAYAVVVLRIRPQRTAEQGLSATVLERRRVRRMQAAIESRLDVAVPSQLAADGGVALLPAAPGAVPIPPDDLLVDLTAAAGGLIDLAVLPAVAPGGVPAAYEQAGEVVRLAGVLGHPAGLHRLDDVLVEYQIGRPTAALDALAHLLDPVVRSPDMLLTLRSYLVNDLDRRRTAAVLHVHPNTLDYRLRKIVDLTGLDPSTVRGLQHLAAALVAIQVAPGA